MKSKELSRAERCGIQLGESIVEMANLMYQKNTKRNFYKGLTKVLSVAYMHEVTLAR